MIRVAVVVFLLAGCVSTEPAPDDASDDGSDDIAAAPPPTLRADNYSRSGTVSTWNCYAGVCMGSTQTTEPYDVPANSTLVGLEVQVDLQGFAPDATVHATLECRMEDRRACPGERFLAKASGAPPLHLEAEGLAVPTGALVVLTVEADGLGASVPFGFTRYDAEGVMRLLA